jgi:transcriptional regulator with XRE-family HTH domain
MTAVEDLLARSRAKGGLPEPRLRRELRENAHLSQAELAAAFGVTRSAVCRWEAGTRRPRARLLEAYLELLDRLATER